MDDLLYQLLHYISSEAVVQYPSVSDAAGAFAQLCQQDILDESLEDVLSQVMATLRSAQRITQGDADLLCSSILESASGVAYGLLILIHGLPHLRNASSLVKKLLTVSKSISSDPATFLPAPGAECPRACVLAPFYASVLAHCGVKAFTDSVAFDFGKAMGALISGCLEASIALSEHPDTQKQLYGAVEGMLARIIDQPGPRAPVAWGGAICMLSKESGHFIRAFLSSRKPAPRFFLATTSSEGHHLLLSCLPPTSLTAPQHRSLCSIIASTPSFPPKDRVAAIQALACGSALDRRAAALALPAFLEAGARLDLRREQAVKTWMLLLAESSSSVSRAVFESFPQALGPLLSLAGTEAAASAAHSALMRDSAVDELDALLSVATFEELEASSHWYARLCDTDRLRAAANLLNFVLATQSSPPDVAPGQNVSLPPLPPPEHESYPPSDLLADPVLLSAANASLIANENADFCLAACNTVLTSAARVASRGGPALSESSALRLSAAHLLAHPSADVPFSLLLRSSSTFARTMGCGAPQFTCGDAVVVAVLFGDGALKGLVSEELAEAIGEVNMHPRRVARAWLRAGQCGEALVSYIQSLPPVASSSNTTLLYSVFDRLASATGAADSTCHWRAAAAHAASALMHALPPDSKYQLVPSLCRRARRASDLAQAERGAVLEVRGLVSLLLALKPDGRTCGTLAAEILGAAVPALSHSAALVAARAGASTVHSLVLHALSAAREVAVPEMQTLLAFAAAGAVVLHHKLLQEAGVGPSAREAVSKVLGSFSGAVLASLSFSHELDGASLGDLCVLSAVCAPSQFDSCFARFSPVAFEYPEHVCLLLRLRPRAAEEVFRAYATASVRVEDFSLVFLDCLSDHRLPLLSLYHKTAQELGSNTLLANIY